MLSLLLLNGTCATYGSCSSCVDVNGCTWCSVTGDCVETSDSSCDGDTTNSCSSPEYIVIIFIVILVVLVCLCFGTCYWRKFRGLEEDLLSPLLPQQARNFLWRNSLQDQGEMEWMCVICGFDNKPRSKHCIMCGTSYQFSLEYKSEKSERNRMKKELNVKPSMSSKSFHKVNVDAVAIPFDDKEGGTQEPSRLSTVYEGARGESGASSFGVSSDVFKTPTKPEPTSISAQSETALAAANALANSSVFFSTTTTRTSLSGAKRREALNYRRLNQLSLRQKSARRRKMWQRQTNSDTGEVIWIRSSAKDIRVGTAPFGYSPGTSFCEPNSQSFISQSRPFRPDDSFGSNNSHNIANALVEASRGNNSISPATRSRFSSKERGDSFGDTALVSSSPGYTSMFDEKGDLQWHKVEPVRQPKKAIMATNAAVSKKLETMKMAESAAATSSPFTYPPPQEDLEAVAAMTFREKQLWFLNHMSRLQKPWSEGCVILDVHRAQVLDESHRALMTITNSDDLHKWLRIQFIGEPGIDAGGLEREWFGLVTKELMSPASGLFTSGLSESLGGSYHINPLSEKFNPQHLSFFRFAGRVFGKAIMEQQPIPATLSLPIRKQMLALPITFSDLEFVDSELHRNLLWLQNNTGVDAASLDFTVTYESFGKKETFELVPGGENIPVTDDNKSEYLIARLKHRMLDSIKPQLEGLLKGVFEVVPPELLSVFDYQELDLLLCGVPEIDLADWMRHTEYLAEYHQLGPRHKVIRWFWLAVEAMSTEERIRLLQFATGCSRVPAQGFKALQSHDGHYRKFNIQSVPKREALYPRSHTCFNKIDLPLYESQAELDAYLSVVINMEIAGFSME